MNDETTAESQAEAQTVDEVEALARWFHDIYTSGGGCIGHHFKNEPAQCEAWAAWLLASDWLAQREAALRSSIAAEIEALAGERLESVSIDRVQALIDAAAIVRGGTK